MLMHSATNNTKDIVVSAAPGAIGVLAFRASPAAWLTVGVLWSCAVCVRMPKLEPAGQRHLEASVPSATR